MMIHTPEDRKTQLETSLIAGLDQILYVDAPNKSEIMDHAILFTKDGWIDLEELNTRVRRILRKKQKIISRDDYVPLSFRH